MDASTRRRRQVLRARLVIAAIAIPVVAVTLYGWTTSVADHFHSRYVVSMGARWCALQPGVASPSSALAALGPPTTSGGDSTSGNSWSDWKFRDVEYNITWFPGNERAQDLWASVSSQWGKLPCSHERIDYSGWYQGQWWQDPLDPGAFQ